MSRPARPAAERFWEKVDRSRGPFACWLWTAGRSDTGYGTFHVQNERVGAHRFAYQEAHGSIPPGSCIDHVCFRRECVNPSHLRVTTAKQNNEHLRGARNNSKSGIRGVSWHKARGKWTAQVNHNGRKYYGGLFTNLADADAAVTAMRAALFSHDDYEPPATADLDDDHFAKALARAAEHDFVDDCD